MMIVTVLLAASAFQAPPAPAVDAWPGWRGPHGTGVAAGSPPVTFGEGQNVRWRSELPGKGLSSPVVFGDRVYVTTAIPAAAPEPREGGSGEAEPPPPASGGPGGVPGGGFGGRRRGAPLVPQRFVVLALDRASGAVVWSRTVHEQLPHQSTHSDGSFASQTIATDGEVVIASFGSFGIFALDRAGELLWSVDLGDMEVQGAFGEGSSPVLADGLVLQTWDHNGDSFLAALDARTGVERWRTPRPRGTSWVTPVVVRGKERVQVVVASAQTIAYDLETGAELWRHGESEPAGERGGEPGRAAGGGPSGAPGDGGSGGSAGRGGRGGFGGGSGPMASAVQHDGAVLVMAGGRDRGRFEALRIERPFDAPDDFDLVIWSVAADTPRIPSPIVVDGLLYALRSNSGILTALDASSGEVVFGPERMRGLQDAYASPIAAGGHLYFAGRDGVVEVVKVGRAFESVAVNRLSDRFDASPAVVGDELFLRGEKALYCVAAGAASAPKTDG